MVPGQCEFTIPYQHPAPYQIRHAGGPKDAYQTLPDSVLAVRNPLVILDWSTNAYHLIDLGQTLPWETFTNDYRLAMRIGIIDCYNELGTVVHSGQDPT